MVADTLAYCRRYQTLSPRFAAAFDFLETVSADKPVGRYELDGKHCFALVQSYATQPVSQAKFEAHRRYIDIQYIQAGRESLLWSPLAALTETLQPFNEENDIAFYGVPPQATPVNLGPGQFAIFFPEDGHAPGIESGGRADVRKIVVKVRG
jgi:biofilm protein TabA